MAIIRNSASALRKGRVGNTTYYVSGQRQIARVSQNSSNYGETARRTEAMQERRARWANLVNFYKLSKGWMKYSFETKSAKQSDYNRFMQVNLNSSTSYLTKDQAALGACVVEPYAITQGSIRPISTTRSGLVFKTDISLGELVIDDETSVQNFSAAVIANNPGITLGYQLSFISYQQFFTDDLVPQVVCAAYEVTLDTTNTEPLRNYLPEFCSTNIGTNLGTSNSISVGCFAYIWSVTEGGKTRVSSQSLINNNLAAIHDYSTDLRKNMAILSYGLDTDSFLMSGSEPQQPTPATQSIEYVTVRNTQNVQPGQSIGFGINVINQFPIVFHLKHPVAVLNVNATMVVSGGSTLNSVTASMVDAYTITTTWPESEDNIAVTELRLFINGIMYTITFS